MKITENLAPGYSLEFQDEQMSDGNYSQLEL